MKLIATVLLWLTAAALLIFWVIRSRGRLTLVHDHRLPRRLVHMMAVLLVMFGWAHAQDRAPIHSPTTTDAATPDEPLHITLDHDPAYPQEPRHPFTDDAARAYAMAPSRHSAWARIRHAMTSADAGVPLGDDMVAALKRWCDRSEDGGASELASVVLVLTGHSDTQAASPAAKQLIAALDQAELAGFYDGWLLAYLWRAAPPANDAASADALATLHARLEGHARMLVALTRAKAALGPVRYQPWMSKAGPPRGYEPLQMPEGFAAEVTRQYRIASAGTWEDEATVRLAVDLPDTQQPAALLRRGQRIELTDGTPLTLRRLDMLAAPKDAPLVLHDRLTGLTVTIPAGRTIGPRELPTYLDKPSQAALAQRVAKARQGDRGAALELEWTLPLAHRAIRQAVGADKEHAGPLALLLMLYDE